MTKVEQLTNVANTLSNDQLDGLIAYTHHLSSEPFYTSAPKEVLASIDRGIDDADAGRVVSRTTLLERIHAITMASS